MSPANSFSNAFPKLISFRTGGLIAGFVGIIICPWLVLGQYIGWLVSYSGLLGSVGGVLIADYWFIRRRRLDLSALYDADGKYLYRSGFNMKAMAAVVSGIAAVLIGKAHPALDFLFQGAWFSGFAVSFIVYAILMRKFRADQSRQT